MKPLTKEDFDKSLKGGRYTAVGCYPVFLVMGDGEALCHSCAAENVREIHNAIDSYADGARGSEVRQWLPLGWEVNYESDIDCANCHKEIECAHPERKQYHDNT